jgi:hypothetical protein
MPVAGGPKITKTGILLEVDAADKLSYPGTGTTWINPVTPGTYNGTLNNISFDSNDSKGALIFTGSNTYVDFGNVGDLSSAWSFQVAFKPAATASGEPYTVLSYASGSDTGSITFKLDYSSSTQEVVLSTFSATGSNQVNYAISGSATVGSWNIINGTYGSQVLALFKGGNLVTSVPTTGSTVGYNASNRLYLGGTYGVDSGFYTGSISKLTVNQADLDVRAVTTNFNAFFSRFGLSKTPGLVTDLDAVAFIEAAALTSEAQLTAINTLVLGLKSNNLWTKMQAIYPFVGGSAFAHKVNLKSPGTYDVIWSGGIIHTDQGSITTATNGVGNTQFIPTTMLSDVSSSAHISFNLAAGTASPYRGVIGTGVTAAAVTQGAQALNIDTGYNAGTQAYMHAYEPSRPLITTTTDKQGLFVVTRTSTADVSAYRRSIAQNFSSNRTGRTFTSYPPYENDSVRLFQLYAYGGATGVTGSFATIGDGLSETDVDNLYSLITTFNTTLGRT